ncbi:hypothetical protein M885DRAFT_515092 [Pelagophyceae sp. CCMP2097]|nr:hypothetical protein M885DRAFT_515092 [Pelagophyceae sp. CCMP2097]
MSGGGARAEAVLRGACGADEVRPLLTRLRMICEGGLTRMFRYEESLLRARGPAQNGVAARAPSSQLWRARTERSVLMLDVGGDESSRDPKSIEDELVFQLDDGDRPASDRPAKRRRVDPSHSRYLVIERPVARKVEAKHATLRHRETSQVDGDVLPFLSRCGLGAQATTPGSASASNMRVVAGRRYVTKAGDVVNVIESRVLPSAEREHVGYLVEVVGTISETANDEARVIQRLLELAAALKPHLHLL